MTKKRLLLAVTLLLTVAGAFAQKINHRLVQLLERDAQLRTRSVAVEKKTADSQIIEQASVKDEWDSSAANVPSHEDIQAGCGKIDALAGIKKAQMKDFRRQRYNKKVYTQNII